MGHTHIRLTLENFRKKYFFPKNFFSKIIFSNFDFSKKKLKKKIGKKAYLGVAHGTMEQ